MIDEIMMAFSGIIGYNFFLVTHSVRLLGWGIGPAQRLFQQGNVGTNHARSVDRNRDPSGQSPYATELQVKFDIYYNI
jgi:hypothetical protein